MAKTTPLVRMLSGALGDLISDRITKDTGALGNLSNENVQRKKQSGMLKIGDDGNLEQLSEVEQRRVQMRIDNMSDEQREKNRKKASNQFFGLGEIFSKMEDLGIEFVEKPMRKNFDEPMTNKQVSDKMDLLESLPQFKNLSESDKFEASGILSEINAKPPSVTYDYEIPEIEKQLGYEFPAIDIDDVLTDPTKLLSDVKKDSPAFYIKGRPFIVLDERNNKAFFADFGMGQSYIRNWAPIKITSEE